MKPTFLGIGAAKAGTGSLFEYLQIHPCVSMFKGKGFHYFDRWMLRGMPIGEYEQLAFTAKPKRIHRGEISPSYSSFLPQIAEAYPGLKLIFMIRNPVDQFVSYYQDMRARQGTLVKHRIPGHPPLNPTVMAFPDVATVMQRMRSESPPEIATRGLYDRVVIEAHDLGLPLHLVDFRALSENQNEAWKGVCEFLEIPFIPVPTIAKNTRAARGSPEVSLTGDQLEQLRDYYWPTNTFILGRFGIDLFA